LGGELVVVVVVVVVVSAELRLRLRLRPGLILCPKISDVLGSTTVSGSAVREFVDFKVEVTLGADDTLVTLRRPLSLIFLFEVIFRICSNSLVLSIASIFSTTAAIFEEELWG